MDIVGAGVAVFTFGYFGADSVASGWVLDRNWQGTLIDGVRIYPPEAFQLGFVLIAAWIALSLVLSLASHETYCRQRIA